ncbi:mitochondrial import receptor subunit TOM34 [Suricata suricatta]|uniref:mitochondrial import receptor subunit TOM34 n=1 Tax=Suricata suricatta TaxID=37032 RepID=UPI001155F489|nr:mitochondrial import receptor subunit TOM34 [Suricata suricatta]
MLCSSDPEEESILFSNWATCHLKDGNCRDYIKDCTSALALVPFSVKPLLRRVAAYEALEKYPLAYVDYKTVLQIDASVTPALEGINRCFGHHEAGVARGIRYLRGIETALPAWSLGLVGPSSPLIFLNHPNQHTPALCHLVLKQYKEAVKDCTEALRLDGKNVKAFYRRAQAYKALKDYKSSCEDISCLLRLEPRNGPAQKLRQEVNQSLN